MLCIIAQVVPEIIGMSRRLYNISLLQVHHHVTDVITTQFRQWMVFAHVVFMFSLEVARMTV